MQQVLLELQPYLNDIRQAKREGRRDFRNAQANYNQQYGALDSTLSNIAGQYGQMSAPLMPQMMADIGGLSSMLGSNIGMADPGEVQTGRNVTATIGAGAVQDLTSDQQRALDYNASVRRQGGIEKMQAKRNARTDWSEYKKDLRSQRRDILEQVPGRASALARDLRADAFNRRMSLSQLALSREQLAMQREAIDAEREAAERQAAWTRHFINQLLEAYGQNSGSYQNPYTTVPGSTADYPRPDYSTLTPSGSTATGPTYPNPYGGTYSGSSSINTGLHTWSLQQWYDYFNQIIHGGGLMP